MGRAACPWGSGGPCRACVTPQMGQKTLSPPLLFLEEELEAEMLPSAEETSAGPSLTVGLCD